MAVWYDGRCTCCGREAHVVGIDDVTALCGECLGNSDYIQCDECGEYWNAEYVEFVTTDDGRTICEYCTEDMDAQDEDEDEE